MKDDSFKDAKTDFDKKECNKPGNAGKYDQKSEKKVPFQLIKVGWKSWKKTDEKTLKILVRNDEPN